MATSTIKKQSAETDLVVTETKSLTFNASGYVRFANYMPGYVLIKAYVLNGNDMPSSIVLDNWQITDAAYKNLTRDVNLVWLKTNE